MMLSSQVDPSNMETIPMAGSNIQAFAATNPLSMDLLDMMSVHSKMSLTHSIVTSMCKQVSTIVQSIKFSKFIYKTGGDSMGSGKFQFKKIYLQNRRGFNGFWKIPNF